MKDRRWLKSILAASQAQTPPLPWERAAKLAKAASAHKTAV